MESSELGRLARRVTVVPGKGADATPIVVYERKRKRRKSSLVFKGLERLVRRSMMAQRAYADSYLKRHDASNAKKKDGWMRDGVYNHARASRRAVKVMRRLLF
jgi:Family of unknown function (DUF6312)